jgi:hypothetical protein
MARQAERSATMMDVIVYVFVAAMIARCAQAIMRPPIRL